MVLSTTTVHNPLSTLGGGGRFSLKLQLMKTGGFILKQNQNALTPAPSVGARGPQMQLRPDDEGGRWLGAGAGLERTAQKVGATGVIAVGRFWGQLETRWP